MVERMTLNHVVAGSIPAVGDIYNIHIIYLLCASIVQWLEFVPSKHEVRVRFPVDAVYIFYHIYIHSTIGAVGSA